MNISEHYDIVFLGGRFSGGLCARFMKLNFKDKKILILEKNEKLNWCPGESTVGVAGLFLVRELGLSTYCYLNHLPKNGFRFLFNDSKKLFSVESCSEIGGKMLPVIPTFQIDRARFDMDLWELNREIGIDVCVGVDICNIVINPKGNHQITFSKNGKNYDVSCEWLVNSAGRASSIEKYFQDLNPVISEGEQMTSSAWGRFSNVADIDLLGNEQWREKAGFSSRYLSTTHFMKEGSWTWHIPIDRGVVSFGIVYDKRVITDDTKSREGFLKLIKKNPFVNKLLENAELLDFQENSQLDFKRQYFALPEKVIFIGEGFGFIDPLYSQGSDIISRQCYMLKHLIESGDQYEPKRQVINQFINNEYEYIHLLYKNQYSGFGSFKVYNIKSKWDFFSYTNRLVWLFYSKKYANFDWLEHELENHFLTMRLTKSIQNGFIELSKHLKSHDDFETMNTNQYSSKHVRFVFEELILASKYNDRFARQNHFSICKLSICELIQERFQVKNLVNNKLFQELITFTAILEFQLSEKWLLEFLESVTLNLKNKIGKDCEDLSIELNDLQLGNFFRSHYSEKVNSEINHLLFEQKYNHAQLQFDHLDEAIKDYQPPSMSL